MKKILILLSVVAISFTGCSKDSPDPELPNYTENLAGRKFRANAWFDDMVGQIYHVLSFKEGGKVEYSIRAPKDWVVNEDYTVLSTYEIESDIVIHIIHKGKHDKETIVNKAVITKDLMSITEGNLKGMYKEYE